MKNEVKDIDSGHLKPDEVKTISETLQVSEDDVRMMEGRMSGGDSSLNTPMRHDGEEGSEWQDWIVDDSETQETSLAESSEYQARREILLQAMSVLNEREAAILTARRLSEPPATLEELSQTHKVSRERIRQIETRAFEKLQEAMTDKASETGLLDASPEDQSAPIIDGTAVKH